MSDKKNTRTALQGICNFFFDTDAERGLWAFQESQYIRKNTGKGYCKKCGKWLREQTGPMKITRVFVLSEESLRTGKMIEQQDYPNNTHEEEVGDMWDYQGHHVLKNGDQLTIYSPNNQNQILWSGTINFNENYWQKNTGKKWIEWFLRECPATLIPASNKK